MIYRFYLIPFDPNAEGIQPLYLSEIGAPATSVVSPLRQYYIVRVGRELPMDFEAIEAMPQVTRVWQESYPALAALGVDVSGLTIDSTAAEIGQEILIWMNRLDCILSIYGVV